MKSEKIYYIFFVWKYLTKSINDKYNMTYYEDDKDIEDEEDSDSYK